MNDRFHLLARRPQPRGPRPNQCASALQVVLQCSDLMYTTNKMPLPPPQQQGTGTRQLWKTLEKRNQTKQPVEKQNNDALEEQRPRVGGEHVVSACSRRAGLVYRDKRVRRFKLQAGTRGGVKNHSSSTLNCRTTPPLWHGAPVDPPVRVSLNQCTLPEKLNEWNGSGASGVSPVW